MLKKPIPILFPVLQELNFHERDKNILFLEKGHKYIIQTDINSKYTSVTTWNHSHFPHFDADKIIEKMMSGKSWNPGHKYWGQTPDQIKKGWDTNKNNVSGAGTDLHFQIECFMNNSHLPNNYTHSDLNNDYCDNLKEENKDLNHPLQTTEWSYFLEFIQDFPDFKPYRTEWIIYHEDLKLAGSIDMVYENSDGTLNIYDWKRAKNISTVNNFNNFALTFEISHLPDSNFWHYALQLNTYQAILEEKYNKKIKDLYLVRLHPDAEEKTYELIKIPDLQKEIKELFNKRSKEV
jgi:hypothetical protein